MRNKLKFFGVFVLNLYSCNETDVKNMKPDAVIEPNIAPWYLYVTDNSKQYLGLLLPMKSFLTFRQLIDTGFTLKHFRIINLLKDNRVRVHIPDEITSGETKSLFTVVQDHRVLVAY